MRCMLKLGCFFGNLQMCLLTKQYRKAIPALQISTLEVNVKVRHASLLFHSFSWRLTLASVVERRNPPLEVRYCC
jgi:hypothetical protein